MDLFFPPINIGSFKEYGLAIEYHPKPLGASIKIIGTTYKSLDLAREVYKKQTRHP